MRLSTLIILTLISTIGLAQNPQSFTNTQRSDQWIEKATQSMDANLLVLAEVYLKRAKKLDPQNPTTYQLLGDIQQRLGYHDRATRYYNRARQLQLPASPKMIHPQTIMVTGLSLHDPR